MNYPIHFLQEGTEVFSFIVTTSVKQASQSYHSYIIAITSYSSIREKELGGADVLAEILVTCKPLRQVTLLKI